MQEQLARNKELTQKLQAASESEEEEGDVEEEGELLVPDAVNEIQMDADGPNPWMLRNHSSGTKEAKIQDPEHLPEPVAHETPESEEEERPGAEEEILLNEFKERRSLRKKAELNQDTKLVSRQEPKGELWWTRMENCPGLVPWAGCERKSVHAHVLHSD